MTPINYIRLVQAAMLAAIVALFVGPNPAFGKPTPHLQPDAFERYVAAHPYGQGVIDTSQAPDAFERYVKSHGSTSTVVLDGRSPDTRDAAQGRLDAQGTLQTAKPVAARNTSGAYNTQFQVFDGRSPDTLDAADTAQLQISDGRSPDTLDAAQNAQNAQLQVLDGRSPDTRDAAQAIQPVEIVNSGSFHWSDAGIGAATGAGLILLLGASMLLLMRTVRRHNVQAT
jgi:hypothetical protein